MGRFPTQKLKTKDGSDPVFPKTQAHNIRGFGLKQVFRLSGCEYFIVMTRGERSLTESNSLLLCKLRLLQRDMA